MFDFQTRALQKRARLIFEARARVWVGPFRSACVRAGGPPRERRPSPSLPEAETHCWLRCSFLFAPRSSRSHNALSGISCALRFARRRRRRRNRKAAKPMPRAGRGRRFRTSGAALSPSPRRAGRRTPCRASCFTRLPSRARAEPRHDRSGRAVNERGASSSDSECSACDQEAAVAQTRNSRPATRIAIARDANAVQPLTRNAPAARRVEARAL